MIKYKSFAWAIYHKNTMVVATFWLDTMRGCLLMPLIFSTKDEAVDYLEHENLDYQKYDISKINISIENK